MCNNNQIKNNIIPEEISKRITSLRFILIFFVVCIHANLTPNEAINYYHYDFIQPFYIEVIKEIVCNILGCASVPLFFLFASYIQFKKNDKYLTLLKKKLKSLILPYVVWTIITIILYFLVQSIPQTAKYFQSSTNIVKNWKVLDWLKTLTYFYLEKDFKSPLVYQFWFIRDLFIFILLSPIFKILCDKVPGLIISIVTLLSLLDFPVYFTVSTYALFFYLLGYFFAKYEINFFEIADKLKYWEYLILLSIMTILFFVNNGEYYPRLISKIISSLFFLKLSNILINNENCFSILEYLSGYSFFLFAFHTPILGLSINKITQKLIPLHGILCLFQFLLAVTITTIIATCTGILLKKISIKTFSILNGGRK